MLDPHSGKAHLKENYKKKLGEKVDKIDSLKQKHRNFYEENMNLKSALARLKQEHKVLSTSTDKREYDLKLEMEDRARK